MEVMDLLEMLGLKVDSMVYMVMGLLFRKMPVELKEYNYNLPHSTTNDDDR